MMTSSEVCRLSAAPPPTKSRFTKEDWRTVGVIVGSLLAMLLATLVALALLVGVGYSVYWYVAMVNTFVEHANTGDFTSTDANLAYVSFFGLLATVCTAAHFAED